MATTGFAINQAPQAGIEPARERTVEEVLTEACNAAASAIRLIEGMESNAASAKDQISVPVGIIASALYLHASLGELHQRIVRLSERVGRL